MQNIGTYGEGKQGRQLANPGSPEMVIKTMCVHVFSENEEICFKHKDNGYKRHTQPLYMHHSYWLTELGHGASSCHRHQACLKLVCRTHTL